MCEKELAERGELIDEESGGVGGAEGWEGQRRVSCLQPAPLPPSSLLVYMMPQEDKGLAIWQVHADWQYWRTVW